MFGLRAYLMGGAALALTALSAVIWWQSGQLDNLRTENARLEGQIHTLEQSLQQVEESKAVAEAWRKLEQKRAATLNASIEALLTGDFDNDEMVLDPRITAYFDCLFRNDGVCLPDPTSGPRPENSVSSE